jgi:thiamine-phosphate pyrophosphorylase
MRFIVITHPEQIDNEVEQIHELFDKGLEYLHIRKPGISEEDLEDFVNQINDQYKDRLVLHHHLDLALEYDLGGIHISRLKAKSWHKKIEKAFSFRDEKSDLRISDSWHSLTELYNQSDLEGLDYIFLSPIFNSISKKEYEASFERYELHKALTQTNQNVVALGGVRPEHIEEVKEVGFSGVAVLGAIWYEGDDPVANFEKFNETLDKIKMPGPQ